jgi:hypothetical protein
VHHANGCGKPSCANPKKNRRVLIVVSIAFIAAAFVTWNHFKLRSEKPEGIVAKSPPAISTAANTERITGVAA